MKRLIVLVSLLIFFGCRAETSRGPDGICWENRFRIDHLDPDCPCNDMAMSSNSIYQPFMCRSDQTLVVDTVAIPSKIKSQTLSAPTERSVVIIKCVCKTDQG